MSVPEELFEVSDDTEMWERLAVALDAAPGQDGAGVSPLGRVRIARLAADPGLAAWVSARSVRVTPEMTVWQAVKRFGCLLPDEQPTMQQLVDGICGATAAAVH